MKNNFLKLQIEIGNLNFAHQHLEDQVCACSCYSYQGIFKLASSKSYELYENIRTVRLYILHWSNLML